MDAPAAMGRFAWPRSISPALAPLARALAWWSMGWLTLAGGLICLRRASGALVEPLPAVALWGSAGLLALTAIAFRKLVAPTSDISTSGTITRRGLLTRALPSLMLLLWAPGLLLGATSGLGPVVFLGILLAEEVWTWWPSRSAVTRRDPVPHPTLPASANPTAPMFAPTNGIAQPAVGAPGGGVADLEPRDAEGMDEEDCPVGVDETVSQRFVRRRLDNGAEMIEGWLRVDFVPQQRHATAHIAICPPLDRVPDCFAEPSDGPPAEVKVAQVLPQGVRFEIKLDRTATEPTSVAVEFAIAESAAEA